VKTIPDNDHRNFASPSVWVGLFALTIGATTYYLTANPGAITVDGHTYSPFPIYLDEIREDGKGEVSSVRLTVSNIEGALSTAIRTSRNVDGATVVFSVYSVDAADVIYEETLEILRIEAITTKSITFELGIFNPFLARLLQEKFLNDFCWNTYKGRGCYILLAVGTYSAPSGFTAGTPDTCGRTLDECRRHANETRYNGFPGIPGKGGYV
jgi:lambda family phage minor tail protein L